MPQAAVSVTVRCRSPRGDTAGPLHPASARTAGAASAEYCDHEKFFDDLYQLLEHFVEELWGARPSRALAPIPALNSTAPRPLESGRGAEARTSLRPRRCRRGGCACGSRRPGYPGPWWWT